MKPTEIWVLKYSIKDNKPIYKVCFDADPNKIVEVNYNELLAMETKYKIPVYYVQGDKNGNRVYGKI